MTARDDILHAVRAARPASVPLPDLGAAVQTFPVPSGDRVTRFTEAVVAAGAEVVMGTRDDLERLTAGEPDVFVYESSLGVAENGAIWLTDDGLTKLRADCFLATHVIVLLDPANIVDTLHAAYERIGAITTSYALFMAGPSKTADIEQSLVIGAHGPKALTILLGEVGRVSPAPTAATTTTSMKNA